MNPATPTLPLGLTLKTAEDTAALARRMAPALAPGDVILLSGPIGAGKTHFARALIQARLAAIGGAEDVPSPTFTLVQTYEADVEIWHADLYRLTLADEVVELGLEEAFQSAICLVEWPDRLGALQPSGALTMTFTPESMGEARHLTISGTGGRWAALIAGLIV